MKIEDNLQDVRRKIPEHVKIVVVSKTQPVDRLMEVYRLGYRIFGENKAQELGIKHPQMPKDVEWHFIGHLQSNKVRMIAPFVHTIQSIDSLKLLQVIDKEAERCSRTINCLLQMYVATEESKFGLDLEEAEAIAREYKADQLKHVRIAGVMGMASFSDDLTLVRKEFQNLYQHFTTLKTSYFAKDESFREVSAGMSGDYSIAIEEGSTIVRLGTVIFGSRYQ
jgi:pyridoxal phosphate enzyme (YggS family)